MVSTTPHPPLYHSITVLLLFFLFITAVTATQRGFSLELIPPFSERSPSCPSTNLIRSQQLQLLVQSSQTHARLLESRILGPNTTTLRPPLLSRDYHYMVKLNIGTGHRNYQLLRFDIGSSLTWIQCNPCNPCFPQAHPRFTPSKSRTYHAIPSDDARCAHPYGPGSQGQCTYEQPYQDGTSTSGDISTETFTFQSSNTDRPEVFPGLIFGCGHSNNFPGKSGDWTGVMGLGRFPVSILMQLGHETRGRFSYCLVKPLLRASTLLRFGDDYEMRRHFHRTPILIYPDFGSYYLTLNDVSFGDQRLGIPMGSFARRAYRTGGFIIDSGSTVSHMIRPAYDRVSAYLDGYFSTHHLGRVGNCYPPCELCYALPAANDIADVLAPMTLHLSGADLRIGWESTYLKAEANHCFCLAMLPADHVSILGAYQQVDIRFVFDVGARVLWFDHENCEDDGAHLS